MTEEELTDEDRESLEQMGYSYPKEEDKLNIFAYFKRVLNLEDNTKTGIKY